jgi:enoyl-CoA hydratase
MHMAHIQTAVEEDVLVVTLNRPEARNAFDRAMAQAMEAVMDDYEAQPALRVAILRAEGPTFSAGQDLKAAERGEAAVSPVRGAFGVLRKPPMKPLIAAVEGQALAGGMELTLCCDLIVASRAATFGLTEVRHSLVALGGGCFRLPQRVPYPLAMEMILTAEPKSAAFMHRLGVVNSVVEPGHAMTEALRFAKLIARNAPLAVQASKEIAWSSMAERWPDEQVWERQAQIASTVLGSEDLREGLRAFAEKRTPLWKGR